MVIITCANKNLADNAGEAMNPTTPGNNTPGMLIAC